MLITKHKDKSPVEALLFYKGCGTPYNLNYCIDSELNLFYEKHICTEVQLSLINEKVEFKKPFARDEVFGFKYQSCDLYILTPFGYDCQVKLLNDVEVIDIIQTYLNKQVTEYQIRELFNTVI